MTSDFPNSSHLPQDQFDTGPLSWVMAEVREAVTNAGKMLKEALAQDTETRSTTILHAKVICIRHMVPCKLSILMASLLLLKP